MDSLCFSCADVSKNLHDVLNCELDYRTSTGKKVYTWKFDIPTALRAAGHGCTFCSFVDYIFLKPYYDPQSLGLVPWKRASTVEEVSDVEFSAFASTTEPTASCVICSAHTFQGDGGLCYLCRPQIARYIARQPDKALGLRQSAMLSIRITFHRSSWSLDENTDVEGLTMSGYTHSNTSLNAEKRFRVDCSPGTFAVGYLPCCDC